MDVKTARLILPFEDVCNWKSIVDVLGKPLNKLSELDGILTHFAVGRTDQKCSFFKKAEEGTLERGSGLDKFDFDSFLKHGVPFMVQVALELPDLFREESLVLLLRAEDVPVQKVSLSRRQVASLLAHSFFGSITADARVEGTGKEKWAFRAAQLFFLEAVPSALSFLNYFRILGKNGVPEGVLTYSRCAFKKKSPPWEWENNDTPLCAVKFVDKGPIEDSLCDVHADFANRFVGGGCLENDFNMEEILFVMKPEVTMWQRICFQSKIFLSSSFLWH